MKSLTIQSPIESLVSSFLDYTKAMGDAGDPVWPSYQPHEGESPADFVKRQNDRAIHPEPPLVAETVYWGVIDGTVVGRVSIRHTLNDDLREMGGHIGYEVHPSYRGQGVATQMLQRILKTPKAREIGRLLITCHPDNLGSNKTILNNGGVLEAKVFVKRVDEYRNHYWITVK